jgi:para-aminobenzoate synthetase/4-amino-4-deoxychorismate lyase
MTPPMDRPDLIVTLAFDPMQGLADLEPQLSVLKADALARGYPFDKHAVRNELQAATFRLREPRLVRLLVGSAGGLAIEVSPPV